MEEGTTSASDTELIGGLINAVKRGETLDQARASLLNAGYKPEAVNLAARAIMGGHTELVKDTQAQSSVNIPSSNVGLYAQQSNRPAGQVQPLSQQQIPPTSPRQKSRRRSRMPIPYWVVILMLLLSVGILVGAGGLGLYWHQLFPS